MRHATDGELHAFLDGGLDLLPEGRGEEVRDHLASCSACRERLQDQEQTRSRAAEIMAGPSLQGLDLPSLEELRERAEASGPHAPAGAATDPDETRFRGPLKGLPMAWAATIILAVGVGWMGGQVWRGIPVDRGPSPSSSAIELPPEIEVPVPPRTAPSGRADLDPESEQIREDSPSAGAVERESGARLEAQAREGTESLPASFDAVAVEPGKSLERTRAEDMPVSALQEVRRSQAGAGPPGPEEELAGIAPAADSAETSLAVPGLKVVSIGWEEKVPGEKALLIRQVLMPGDTLELRYLGMLLGSEAEARARPVAITGVEEVRTDRVYASVLEASLPPGWTQVVMERGRGLLVARAPISESNLKALLKTIH